MGIFNLFNKKETNSDIVVYAPFAGTVKPLEKMKDEVFSKKMMGDGVAITPSEDDVFSPLDKGSMINVFHTKHAYGIATGKGPELLVHLGMDTVTLEGKGFEAFVEKGQGINKETKIANANWKAIKKNKKIPSIDTPIIITNDSIGNYKIEFIKTSGKVEKGEPIYKLVK